MSEKWYDKKITFGKKKAVVDGNVVEKDDGTLHHTIPKSVKKKKKKMSWQSDRNYWGPKSRKYSGSRRYSGSSRRYDTSSFSGWYRYNTTLFWMLVVALIAVLGAAYFFIAIYERPIKEGLVVGKFHDDEHVGYYEDSKSVTRTEFYTTVDSDGKSHSKTRQVHDHYEYRVEEHFDGEDHFIQIEQPSKKHEGKILTRYVYVTPTLLESIKEGKWFVIDKDRGDSTRDPNNDITGVTKWSRSHADLTPWKDKEY